MQIQSFLEVIKIENKVAINGRKFQQVTFKTIKFLGERQITSAEMRSRNIWDSTTLEDGRVIKADPHYNQLTLGALVEGEIKTFNTTPYAVGENQVTTWTGVVFSNENAEKIANQQLRDKNAKVVTNATASVTSAYPAVKQAPTPLAVPVPADVVTVDGEAGDDLPF